MSGSVSQWGAPDATACQRHAGCFCVLSFLSGTARYTVATVAFGTVCVCAVRAFPWVVSMVWCVLEGRRGVGLDSARFNLVR